VHIFTFENREPVIIWNFTEKTQLFPQIIKKLTKYRYYRVQWWFRITVVQTVTGVLVKAKSLSEIV